MIKNPVVILKDIDRLKRLVEDLKAEYNINDFDIKIYDAEKIELEKILSEFDYNPIFSQKSLFIIKNVENFSKNDCEKLYKTIKKLTSDIIIILYGISINPPFEESKFKKEPVSPENIFFKRIYELKEKDRKKIIETLRDYMKSREKNFSPLISGIEIYLRNILYKERKLKEETIKNFDLLYNLDYFLKTGVIEAGSELEIYLFFYFFSVSS
jgi:DNA polymerase III delta subunit